jgi:acyl-CoA thioester hydrolase
MSALPFRYFLRVRYGECDAQKVVYNARYGDYVDIAVSEFLRALGFGEELVDGTLDYQLVKQTIEWRASARYDDVLEVRVATRHIGTTSFTLGCEFRQAGSDTLLATAETVYVHVDACTLAKAPLQEDLRAALKHGAPDETTDHAGYRAATEGL